MWLQLNVKNSQLLLENSVLSFKNVTRDGNDTSDKLCTACRKFERETQKAESDEMADFSIGIFPKLRKTICLHKLPYSCLHVFLSMFIHVYKT
jgi:hypothetical protein